MSDQPPAKMAKVEENGSGGVEGTYKDFGSFQFERVLKENSERY